MFDREMVVKEFDQEMTVTRRTLSQVPADRMDWRPHEKSMTLGELATHLAILPSWVLPVLTEKELDLDGADEPASSRASPGPKGLLERFDENVEEARKRLVKAKTGNLEDPWTLRSGDQVFFTLPRWMVLRRSVLNHMVHHRGQLGVYLRLLDLEVPGSYGPTADDHQPTRPQAPRS